MHTTAAPDNLLGICHRVGCDFGFNPLWLRLAFASVFLFAPLAVVGSYLALGGFVLASRMLFPSRRAEGAQIVALPVAESAPMPIFAKAA